jgi:predicted secreted Zn-dependent protease
MEDKWLGHPLQKNEQAEAVEDQIDVRVMLPFVKADHAIELEVRLVIEHLERKEHDE